MSIATHTGASTVTGSRLATRLAAVAVVLALAALAAFTIFSGPTTIKLRAPTSRPLPTRTITVPSHREPERETGNHGD
jgi:hypothetical protein